MADPVALSQAVAAWQAFERVGSPEGDLAIAQCTIYLATAPKSNGVYKALENASSTANESGSLLPPKHILNAPTSMMKGLGYGDGYVYDHEVDGAFTGQNYFPDGLSEQRFYEPSERGFEKEIMKRLDHWLKLKKRSALND